MGACDFCLSCSGLIGDKFFSLSLMLFGGRIGDLCNGCFAEGAYPSAEMQSVYSTAPADWENMTLQYRFCRVSITWIVMSNIKLATIAEGDSKAPF